MQKIIFYFLRGSITVRLTSCLAGQYWIKQVAKLKIKDKQSSLIQKSEKGVMVFSDTSLYNEGLEYSTTLESYFQALTV